MQLRGHQNSRNNRISAYYQGALILFLFCFLTVIFTFPLILNFQTAKYGVGGDSLGTIWHFWWLKYASQHNLSPHFTPLISAPFGVPKTIEYALLNYIVLGLSFFFNEIAIYNFLIFVSFPLSAFLTYLLVYYLTANRAASFLAGVIFAFSPFNLVHAQAHLMFVQLIPLYVLSLLKLNEKRTYFCAVLCGLSFSLLLLFNFYFGFFMIIFTLIFIVFTAAYQYLIEKKSFLEFHLLRVWSVFFSTCFLIMTPFIYSMLKISSRYRVSVVRSFSDLRVYSTRLWEYVVPPVDNPLFGRFFKGFVDSHLHGSNIIEQTLYLGLVPLSLVSYAVFKRVWEKEECSSNNNLRFIFSFFVVIALASILFSLPPFIAVAGYKLYFPSFLFYKIAPTFRVYARFGIIVMLSVAVLAGFGAKYLTESLRDARQRFLTVAGLVAIIILEFTNVPPFRVMDLSRTPKVYKWLEKRKGEFIIAEYPLVRSDKAINDEYRFYQRVHQKRLANGALPGTFAERVRSSMTDISNPSTYDMLNHLGVKYVIFHKGKYGANFNGIPKAVVSRLRLIESFGEDVVYEVRTSKPKVIIFYNDNFYSADYWQDGRSWNWMSNNGKLVLDNRSGKEISVEVSSEHVVSIGEERSLRVFVNGRQAGSMKGLADEPKKLSIKNVRLKPGRNLVRFYTPQEPKALSSISSSYDSRKVSIGYRSFQLHFR